MGAVTSGDGPSQDIVDAFVAAAHGDLDTVRRLLAQFPALLNASASWVETALGAAAQTGQVPIAMHLLAAGAPLDICTAAMLGSQADVTRLLPHVPGGANALGAHGIPLIYHAAIGGHLHIAELLLAHDADLNAGAGGSPALHGAVLFNQLAMVQWLLANGADVDIRNHAGQTPLAVAYEKNHDAIAEVLQEWGGV